MRRFVFFHVVLLLLSPGLVFGWNHTGHRVSSLIAYRQLSPETRRQVDEILRAHPRYAEDLLSGMPGGHPRPEEWAFMTAATWPDMIRSQAHPLNRRWHRGEWHYINIPFIQPGDDPATMRPQPAGVMQWDASADPTNVVQALQLAAARVQSSHTPADERAIMLCWYLHLAGDIHQPLHASTRFSTQFPDGDRGGNSLLIADRGVTENLHAFWDGLLGNADHPTTLSLLASFIAAGHPSASMRDDVANLSYHDWAWQSHEIARTAVYLDGAIAGVTHPPTTRRSDPLPPGVELPAGYNDRARLLALERIALAGHRIAADLNQLLLGTP